MFGRFIGSSVDIVPLNRACAGSPSCSVTAVLSDVFPEFDIGVVGGGGLLPVLSGGTQVKLALLNPPMSESHIIFVAPMLSSLSKYMRGNGLVGTCRPLREAASVHGMLPIPFGAKYLHVHSYYCLPFKLC